MRADLCAAHGLLPALAMLLVAGCSCNDARGTADLRTDTLPRDSSVDLGVDVGVDWGVVDRGAVDRAVDRGLDAPFGDYAVGACGGSRKMSPVLIPKRTGMSCGPACKQLTWGASPSRLYAVAGDLLTYVNTLTGGGYRVYYVDLKTEKEYRLHENWKGVVDGCSVVATDGKQLATSCVRAGGPGTGQWLRSLTLYDPATRVETDQLCLERKDVTKGCFPDLIALNATGITIKISLGSCPLGSAYHLPFGGTSLQNLAGATGGIGHVRGSGDTVVWMQYEPAWKAYQIVAYNLKTKTMKRVSPSPADQWMPQVAGNKIVWVDHRNDPSGYRLDPRNTDIYIHDLKTGKTEPVLLHPARQEEPDVWGDWVVWIDYRDNPDLIHGKEVDIYAKNLVSGVVHQITDYPYLEVYPRVDHDRLFYQMIDTVNKWRGIFMVDLPAWVKAKAQTKAKPTP